MLYEVITAICQPAVEITPCAIGEANVNPSEPMPDIAPIANERFAGDTACEVIDIAMLAPVQDIAVPMHNPAPRVNTSGECDTRLIAMP